LSLTYLPTVPQTAAAGYYDDEDAGLLTGGQLAFCTNPNML